MNSAFEKLNWPKNNMRIILIALALYLSFLTPSFAQEKERYTSVNIIPERTHDIKAGDTITIATEVNLAPKWHVYWRNPGDSGLPVMIKWDAPEGFIFDEIQWPTPDKISYDILANYGYYTKVTLLQKLYIPDSYNGERLTLNASIDMLVCNDICIPESSDASVVLNDPDLSKQDNVASIKNAIEKLPKILNGAFTYTEKEQKLEIIIDSRAGNFKDQNLEFFPYEWGIIKYTSKPAVNEFENKIILTYDRDDRDLNEIEKLQGVLAIISDQKGENQGFEISATKSQQPNTQAQPKPVNSETQKEESKENLNWLTAIGLAFIGGLILNLMPCVFPVLSMKALSLVKMGDQENVQAKIYGISYTAGVTLSFIAMGIALVILQQTGSAIGWGFQLQNPVIVTLLSYLLFIIGLNLMGFFDMGNNFGNIGSKLTQGSSVSSSFFTGTLVTFVAAPCIGPFLGAAMGYAITQPALFNIIFFASLGLGLASPYLVLSFIPQTRTLLPKPGPWMNTFKQALSFPMFASAIIFIWVLSQQSGTDAALIALIGLLLISFTIWLLKLKKNIITIILLILGLSTIALTIPFIKSIPQTNSKMAYSFGKPFSQTALKEALETDKPVFVEMTAAWCFTCKINHAVAINVQSTKTLFEQRNVQYLIGDWTNHDEIITEYLDQFERNGVPLYVYYAPPNSKTGKRPAPKLLPQVLTPGIVKETIEQN